jgi:hypothetical protein
MHVGYAVSNSFIALAYVCVCTSVSYFVSLLISSKLHYYMIHTLQRSHPKHMRLFLNLLSQPCFWSSYNLSYIQVHQHTNHTS